MNLQFLQAICITFSEHKEFYIFIFLLYSLFHLAIFVDYFIFLSILFFNC